MEVTHAPPIAYGVKDKTAEALLEDATLIVKQAPAKGLFIDFLKAFMEAESQHIGKSLSKDNFNLRNASLCAEAYATAQLMLEAIEDK